VLIFYCKVLQSCRKVLAAVSQCLRSHIATALCTPLKVNPKGTGTGPPNLGWTDTNNDY